MVVGTYSPAQLAGIQMIVCRFNSLLSPTSHRFRWLCRSRKVWLSYQISLRPVRFVISLRLTGEVCVGWSETPKHLSWSHSHEFVLRTTPPMRRLFFFILNRGVLVTLIQIGTLLAFLAKPVSMYWQVSLDFFWELVLGSDRWCL